METKFCTGCSRDLPTSAYNKNDTKKDGLQSRCIECSKAYYKNYYRTNPKEKARLRANGDRDREILRQEVRDLKESSPCSDCGKHYPYYVMDFDHLSDKLFNVSNAITRNIGLAKLRAEIEKCEIVCANCHRIRTHDRYISDSSNGKTAGLDPVNRSSNL